MIDERLVSLGIVLPEPPAPAGSYTPVRVLGNTAYVSGQIPLRDGSVAYAGRVNDGNIGKAQKAAVLCIHNMLANLRRDLGSLERISGILKLEGFVNSEAGFTAHPRVINAASDLLVEIFGEKARHARTAIGVSGLPLDSMVEISAIIQID